MYMTDQERIQNLLNRGVDTIYPKPDMLQARLEDGKKLRIYVGFDPTGPHLHIGHAMQLKKLKEFQDLGHEVIMLIGSFTAMIGDPTDKGAVRVPLTKEQVKKNAETYKKQAEKIISFSGKNPAKLKFNDEWLAKMNFDDVLQLTSKFTVQQMLERDMFENRMKEGKPIHLHEFLYPLMQGYDSVAMDVDLEIGGSDQTFNMLAGRTLMKSMKQKEKMVLTLELLTNDEGKKMSKSEGGFIALDDAPEQMFGKIMAMHDSMIHPYFRLVTDTSEEELARIEKEVKKNPRDLKARLATEIVSLFHDAEAAQRGADHFERVFVNKEMPEDMPEHRLDSAANVIDLLIETKLVSSRSEARRMIDQKAIKLDGEPITEIDVMIESKGEQILQRGKRQFVKLIPGE
jgi:tyrosyl-tRNA synthetase